MSNRTFKSKELHLKNAILLGVILFIITLVLPVSYINRLIIVLITTLIINVVLNRINSYGYKFFIASFLVYAIMLIIYIQFFAGVSPVQPVYSIGCLPNPGFYCKGINYWTNGTANLVISQGTDPSWSSVEFLFVNGSGKNIPSVDSWDANTTQLLVNMQKNRNYSIDMRISGNVSAGTSQVGTLWVRYNNSNAVKYAIIGQVSAIAKQ